MYIRDIRPDEKLTTITLAEAEKFFDVGVAKAKEFDVRIVLVIVDVFGEIVAVRRMDGCRAINTDWAYAIAYTCALFQLPWERLMTIHETGWWGALNAQRVGKIGAAPGYPIKRGEDFIGGVGISGCDGSFEVPILQAGLAAVA